MFKEACCKQCRYVNYSVLSKVPFGVWVYKHFVTTYNCSSTIGTSS